MQEHNDRNSQKPISMEEYLYKRQQIREAEEQQTRRGRQKKSPAYMLAELYV